jgi:hypothetical protein
MPLDPVNKGSRAEPRTFQDFDEIVRSRSWQALVGQLENEIFDCKKTGYDLVAEAQKHELAKDVSSFANAGGGFIILGVETKKSERHPTDEVAALRPFAERHLDSTQYLNILETWLTPKLEGVTVEWCPSAEDPEVGFGVIRIPPQTESRGPILISKVVLESGNRRDMLVGFAQRKRDRSAAASASDLAAWLRDGRAFHSTLSSRLNEIVARLDDRPTKGRGLEEGAGVELRVARLKEYVHSILTDSGLVNRPYYALAAAPENPLEVRTILSSGPDTAAWLLEHPPEIRRYGWGLGTLEQARLVKGSYRETRAGDDLIIRLHREGAFVAAGAADDAFLGRGESAEDFQRDPCLVSLAVIEFTYLFFECYRRILRQFVDDPGATNLCCLVGGMRRREDTVVGLDPLPVGPFSRLRHSERLPAPENSMLRESRVTTQLDPGTLAYWAVKELYAWFGAEPEKIPYATESEGAWRVDPEKIKSA